MNLKLLSVLMLGVIVVAFSGCTESPTEGGKPTTSPVQASVKPSKYISLEYGDDGLYRKIGYSTPSPGNKYLVTRIDLENHGYDEFYVNPNYFRAHVNGVEYGYSSSTFSLENINLPHLQTVTLRNGGATSGYLVFELPDSDTITYKIIDTRQGSYRFEYGHIPEIETKTEPEAEPIIRDVSFYFGSDLFAISKDKLKGSIGYNSYSTTASTSQDGADANQVTKVDRDEGFLVIGIKTYLTEEGRPVDENKAIDDALIGAEKYVPVYANRINKGGTYETTLSSGEKVDVHVWKAPSNELYKGEANVCCFMPDDSTVVTVVASLSNSMTTRFFETLEIGDIPQS